ncbi:MAG: hypothetical protein GY737_17410 [Desulfobacteraceae bacterium]|nr:hypothetical protein [Desulfobacteraceae bacterium]
MGNSNLYTGVILVLAVLFSASILFSMQTNDKLKNHSLIDKTKLYSDIYFKTNFFPNVFPPKKDQQTASSSDENLLFERAGALNYFALFVFLLSLYIASESVLSSTIKNIEKSNKRPYHPNKVELVNTLSLILTFFGFTLYMEAVQKPKVQRIPPPEQPKEEICIENIKNFESGEYIPTCNFIKELEIKLNEWISAKKLTSGTLLIEGYADSKKIKNSTIEKAYTQNLHSKTDKNKTDKEKTGHIDLRIKELRKKYDNHKDQSPKSEIHAKEEIDKIRDEIHNEIQLSYGSNIELAYLRALSVQTLLIKLKKIPHNVDIQISSHSNVESIEESPNDRKIRLIFLPNL